MINIEIMGSVIKSRLREAKEFYLNLNINEYAFAFPIAAILGIAQMAMAASQKNKRPVQPETTKATDEATQLARQRAGQTTDPILSGELSEIEQSSASAIDALKRTLKDPGAILSGVSKVTSGANRAKRGALREFSGRQEGRTRDFMSQLARTAQEQSAAFQFNEAQKYGEQSATKSALTQAGLKNIAGGYHEYQVGKQNQALMDYLQGGSYGNPVSNNNYNTTLMLADQNIRNDLKQTASNVG